MNLNRYFVRFLTADGEKDTYTTTPTTLDSVYAQVMNECYCYRITSIWLDGILVEDYR